MGSQWIDDALCAEVDTELWYPESFQTEEGREQADEAKRMCGRCPVWKPCLRRALAVEGGKPAQYRFGVVGRLTPAERVETERILVERGLFAAVVAAA